MEHPANTEINPPVKVPMEQSYPIYLLGEHPGKSECGSLSKETNLSMKQASQLKQYFQQVSSHQDSQPNNFMTSLSPTKNRKSLKIKVVECQCQDCQEMKDKPVNRNYGPQLSTYLDMFPIDIKNRPVV
jgi:hypothetical protein